MEDEYNQLLNDYSDILTFKEFQKIIKYGRNKCYQLLRENKIKNVRLGKDYRIIKASLIRFLLAEQN